MAVFKGKNGEWKTTETGQHIFIADGETFEQALEKFEKYTLNKKINLKDGVQGEIIKTDGDLITVKDIDGTEQTYTKEQLEEYNSDDVYENELDEDLNYEQKIKPVKKYIGKKIDELTDEEIYEYLTTNSYNLDEEKLKNLTPGELKNLTIAKMNLQYKPQVKENKIHDEIQDLNEENKIWKYAVPETAKEIEKSLNAKIDYYNEAILDNSDNEIFLKKLEICEDIKNNLLPKLKSRERRKNRALKRIQESKDLISKYEKTDGLYSQKAKNEALWFKNPKDIDKYYSHLKNKDDYIKTYGIDSYDLNEIISYTSSYSSVNNPLRNKVYEYAKMNPEKKGKFINSVNSITKALNKCSLKDNMWLQRGVYKLNINGKDLKDLNLDSLNGTVFEDQGFLSCGTGKDTGFSTKKIIMNIYCPKGTKALYVAPISHYPSEKESIIQRGYSYRITKAYKDFGKYYLDCEVLLGSDDKKYDDKKLKGLKEKYL